MDIDKAVINKYIKNMTFVERGERYYRQFRTMLLDDNARVEPREITFKTKGSRSYMQEIYYDSRNNKLTKLECTCPAYDSYGPCKHLASALMVLEEETGILSRIEMNKVQEIASAFYNDSEEDGESFDVYGTLKFDIIEGTDNCVELSFGVDVENSETETKHYQIHDLNVFFHKYQNENDYLQYIEANIIAADGDEIDPTNVILDFESHAYLEDIFYNAPNETVGIKKIYDLSTDDTEALACMFESTNYNDIKFHYVAIDGSSSPISRYEETRAEVDEYWCLEHDGTDEVRFYLYTEQPEHVEGKLEYDAWSQELNFHTHPHTPEIRDLHLLDEKNDAKRFMIQKLLGKKYYYGAPIKQINMEQHIDREAASTFEVVISQKTDLGVRFELDIYYKKGGLTVNLETMETRSSGKLVPYDEDEVIAFERLFEETVNNKFTRAFNHYGALFDYDSLFEFLNEDIPALLENEQFTIEVLLDDKVRRLQLVPLRFEVTASSGLESMIDLSLEKNEELSIEDLQTILTKYTLKSRYIHLGNGVLIDTEDKLNKKRIAEMETFKETLAQFEKSNAASIPRFQIFNYSENAKGKTALKLNKDIQKMIKDVKTLKPRPLGIPKTFNAELREYQLIGVYWMQQLAKYQFGGILADEMGLGKTVQVIAYLATIKKPTAPSLIIAPKTLMYNWEAEFKKFAPFMNVVVIDGTPVERTQRIASLKPTEIAITSYPLIVKDFEHYTTTFDNIIIDEAQYIKNPATKMAKIVRLLPSKQRFALTGTPMENSLMEVWSIFDFLMQGFLKTQKDFRQKTFNPVYKDNDAKVLKQFKEVISPFVLRREKEQVLTELPNKIETTVYCEMDKKQRKLYSFYLAQAQEDIRAELSNDSFDTTGKIKILAIITRLRQVCTHPSMFLENYDGESAKLETLCELLKEAIHEGHRILLFSQFTSMLRIIEEKMTQLKLPTLYLHGQTKAKERLELVEDFNSETPSSNLFLLSLKAGGTGLNLTSADIVIHFDPWWNPSVENQATDRAHRYGQEKAVQVMQFIAKDSIEERIQELKKSKQEMFDALFTHEEQAFNKLTKEDIEKLLELK